MLQSRAVLLERLAEFAKDIERRYGASAKRTLSDEKRCARGRVIDSLSLQAYNHPNF